MPPYLNWRIVIGFVGLLLVIAGWISDAKTIQSLFQGQPPIQDNETFWTQFGIWVFLGVIFIIILRWGWTDRKKRR
jgi:hypothetical protein